MGQYVERIGYRAGQLTVVECLEPSRCNENRGGRWRCKCDCGNNREVQGYTIVRPNGPKCCGCTVRSRQEVGYHKRRRYAEATISMWYRYHVSAARKGKRPPLSRSEWLKIVFSPCVYCGQMDTKNAALAPSFKQHQRTALTQAQIEQYEVKLSGVDRVDSDQGYDPENCVPCCCMCNRMKLDHSLERFLQHVARVYHHNHLTPDDAPITLTLDEITAGQ